MDDGNSPIVTKQGGFLGILAFVDALNIWDVIKALGRATRWLFVGVRHRKTNPSYRDPSYNQVYKSTDHPNVVFGATTRMRSAQGGYIELAESDRGPRSPFDDVHLRATDTLL